MNKYIATFYSHFGAVRFSRELKAHAVTVRLGPVPRFLSSSCGTCAEFDYADDPDDLKDGSLIGMLSHPDEIEQLILIRPDGSWEAVKGLNA